MQTQPTETIILLGDVHGVLFQAKNAIGLAIASGSNTILQLGDFGIWPGDAGAGFRKKLNHELKKARVHLYFVDGNHEDFTQLYAFAKNPDGTGKVGSNITHLPRGFRWNWHGVSFLAMGGAHSVDRQSRTEGRSWWREETITQADFERAVSVDEPHADVMVCHDSPTDAPNPIVDNQEGAEYWPPEELVRAAGNRLALQSVVDVVQPYCLWHGHYHRLMTGTFETGGHPCRVLGLDEGGRPDRAMAQVNLTELKQEIDAQKESQ